MIDVQYVIPRIAKLAVAVGWDVPIEEALAFPCGLGGGRLAKGFTAVHFAAWLRLALPSE
jgi:hypothetical protein